MTPQSRLTVVGLAACLVVVVAVAAVAVVNRPEAALIGVLCAMAVALAFKPVGRLIFFAVGILALFQSSAIPGAARAGFLFAILILAIPAAVSAARSRRARSVNLRRFVAPAILLVLLVGIGSISLLWSPRSVDDWTRDATTYILIAAAPIFGIDAALHAKRRTIEFIVLAVGLVGAFSYLVTWLSRRGYGILGLEQFALASSLLAIPSIAMSLAYCYRPGAQRWLWAFVGLLQVGMLASAGGRSALIYLVALLLVFIIFGTFAGSWVRGATTISVAGLLVGTALISLTGALGIQEFLIGRYDWFAEASSFSAIESDLSGQARLRAIDYMLEGFSQAPLLGNGLGVNYTSVTTHVVTAGTYSLDTPLTSLSKFGIIGTVILLVAVVLFVRAAWTAAPAGGRGTTALFLMANVAVWVAQLLNGLPTEQKGFAVQIALMSAYTVSWAISDVSVSEPAGLRGIASPHKARTRGRPVVHQ